MDNTVDTLRKMVRTVQALEGQKAQGIVSSAIAEALVGEGLMELEADLADLIKNHQTSGEWRIFPCDEPKPRWGWDPEALYNHCRAALDKAVARHRLRHSLNLRVEDRSYQPALGRPNWGQKSDLFIVASSISLVGMSPRHVDHNVFLRRVNAIRWKAFNRLLNYILKAERSAGDTPPEIFLDSVALPPQLADRPWMSKGTFMRAFWADQKNRAFRDFLEALEDDRFDNGTIEQRHLRRADSSYYSEHYLILPDRQK